MKKRKLVIIITGKAGAGKSTLAEIFKGMGFEVVDVDHVAHEVLEEKKDDLVSIFGPVIVGKSGEVNREALGRIVFRDKNQLEVLERVVHPILVKKLKDIINSRKGHIVLDVAIPHKLGLFPYADFSIVVESSPEKIKERLQQKGWSTEKIESVLKNQEREVLEGKYFILSNNGTFEELREGLFKTLKQEGIIYETGGSI